MYFLQNMEQTAARSVTNETRAKFDALLKAALHKNAKRKSTSTQQLIEENEASVGANLEDMRRTKCKEKTWTSPVKDQATKSKEDVLLEAALSKNTKNKSKSTQELVDEETYSSISSDTESDDVLDMRSDISDSKNFILNRFLNTSEEHVSKSYENSGFKEPPVPKPRKSKVQSCGSSSSKNTHSVKSRAALNIDGKPKSCIKKNFLAPKYLEDSTSSENSCKTYNISKHEAVGDILVHNQPDTARSKVSVIEIASANVGSRREHLRRAEDDAIDGANRRSQKARKINYTTNTDDSSNELQQKNMRSKRKTKNSDGIETNSSKVPSSSEEVFELQLLSSRIEYENEIKPKPKLRTKNKTKQEESNLVEENTYKYEKITSITIHRMDKLELNAFVIHPVVKIHIVNAETGEYLKKTNRNRSVMFYLENSEVAYLLPVITQNFNLQKNRSLQPLWEETVLINEDFEYLINPRSNVIVFFEVLDFISFSQVNSTKSLGTSRGWYNIAWAFLKVVGKNNALNTDKKVRLQLYKPGKPCSNVPSSKCDAFYWWCRKKLLKYPSTLYVTVKGVTWLNKMVQTFRPKTPLQNERVSTVLPNQHINFQNELNPEDSNDDVEESKSSEKVLTHFEFKTCKLPNKQLIQLDGEDEGCFALKFSHSGLHLACSVLVNNMYTLSVYSVLDFDSFYKLPSHQGLIYNISWSKDDGLIISSSADGTVCIWNMKKLTFLQMLPHPTYVYWSTTANDDVIVTCCFDHTVRIWTPVASNDKLEYVLHDELEAHKGYVTCACFNKDSNLIVSADCLGTIIEWKADNEGNWYFSREIKIPELKEVNINQIILHKNEKRLIVHARDNILRILDVKTECVIHWLEGAHNNKVRTLCCVTPCFSYVLTGDETGTIHVWNIDTANTVATYHPYSKYSLRNLSVHCVDYSSKQNMFVFSHYGHKIPIKVYVNDDSAITDVDVHFISNVNNRRNKSDDSMKSEGGNMRRNIRSTAEKTEKKINLQHILEKIDKIIG